MANNISAMELFKVDSQWLTPEELKQAYYYVYPERIKSKWDETLNSNSPMPIEAVREELGEDMAAIYPHLLSTYKLQFAGARKHSEDPMLFRHLWNTTWRAGLIGLPLEGRLATIMHEIPEHRARGADEAYHILGKIRADDLLAKIGNGGETTENLAQKVTTLLEIITDYESIAVDHMAYCLSRNGTRGNLKNLEGLAESARQSKEALARSRNKAEVFYGEVREAIAKLGKTIGQRGKRIIPPELTDLVYMSPAYICEELKAALNPKFVERVFKSARDFAEKERDDYYLPIAIRAISHIDRLRTAEGKRAAEKSTREAMTFLEKFGGFIEVLNNSGMYNNTLYFLNAALKTELLKELEEQSKEFSSRRDSAFINPAKALESRYQQACKLYKGHLIK